MSGLLVKDFKLVFKRKRFLIILLAIMIILFLNADAAFAIFYPTMVGMIMAISTISYDEYDNGYSFLFTLPITRKGYVLEKFLFGFIWITGCWIFGNAVHLVMSSFRAEAAEILAFSSYSFFILGVFVVMLSIMISIELSFGMEKSRMVLALIFGVCMVIGFVGPKLMTNLGITGEEMSNRLSSVPDGLVALVWITAAVVITVGGFIISTRVMEKKEF
jgi:hypothetical protein